MSKALVDLRRSSEVSAIRLALGARLTDMAAPGRNSAASFSSVMPVGKRSPFSLLAVVGAMTEKTSFGVDGRHIGALRQHHRPGNLHAQFRRQGKAEKFVVGVPPQGIVDDERAGQRGVLEGDAVVGNFLADAVDEHPVRQRFRLADAAQLGEFRLEAGDFVHLVDKGVGEGVFPADDDANALGHSLVLRSGNPLLCFCCLPGLRGKSRGLRKMKKGNSTVF